MASPRAPRRGRAPAPQSPRLALLFSAVILAAGAATYWNSLHGPFVWDDDTAIVTNQTIRDVGSAWWPPRETPVAGRPVANLSLALNYAAHGLDVTGYHAVNIALHLACALLLFAMVRQTLHKPDLAPAAVSPDAIALAASLLWLVHPLQSEVVNYVTQRTESIMALFLLLTLYCAIRARRSPRHAARWEAGAVAACVLGMASKETMVVAPIVVVLYDLVFEFRSVDEALRARTGLYAGLAASWLLLGTLIWLAARSTVGVTEATGPWTSLLNQFPLVVRYLRLTIWPSDLVLDYGLPRALTLSDVLPSALLVAALVAVTAMVFIRQPKIGFPAVIFFLTLAPSSSVVPVLTEVGAERRMYVPSAALAVLAAAAGGLLLARLRTSFPERARLYSIVAVSVLVTTVAVLAARTVVRNRDYASGLALWTGVVQQRPHGRARMALASELIAANRHAEAMSELKEAVRDFPDARYALGTELFAAGNVAQAITELQAFVNARPAHPDRVPGRLLLGQILAGEGRLAEAATQFQAVLDHDAAIAVAREGLNAVGAAYRGRAEALLRDGNPIEAERHAREAARLLRNDPAALNVLGVALASQERIDEAIAQFQEALRVDPANQQARNNLAFAAGLARERARKP